MNNLEGGCIGNETFTHICKEGKAESGRELDQLDKVMFKCGICKEELRTICQLHEHLLTEFLFGSYLYNHNTRTAFPVHESVSKETQTENQCQKTESQCCTTDCQCDREIVDRNRVENHSERLNSKSHVILDNERQENVDDEFRNKKKRKLINNKREVSLRKSPKKKKRPKTSNLYKNEDDEDATEEVNDGTKQIEESHEPLKSEGNQLNIVKEELFDNSYEESTDENMDYLQNSEFKVNSHSKKEVSMVNGHSKKELSIMKEKNETKTKVRASSKSKKSHKPKIKLVKQEQTLTEAAGKDIQGVSSVSDYHSVNENALKNDIDDKSIFASLNKEDNVKKRGRPRNKTGKFLCELCDTEFYSEKRYNMHLYSVHKSSYPFTCKQCNFWPFKNKEDYNKHKESHPKQVFSCELCGKELKSREGLKLHEFIHSGEKPYSCDQCDYKGRTSTQLRQHMYTHMDSKTEQCEHCGKAFFTKGKLKEHLRYCRKEFNHHCPHCQKGFPTNSGLRKHILMHTGERAFVCDVCGFATFRITLLNSHMRTHTGEKPHKCKECGAKLATRGTLLLHLRTHTHEKPFVCSYCSKAFTSKWNLQTHLRQHTGETPYKCEICGQGFKQNVLRKAHMRSHLESTSIEPDTCTSKDLSTELHTTFDPDNKEHNLQNHMASLDTGEPANITVSDRSLDPDKIHLPTFVYDNRSMDEDITNQVVSSEKLQHPLDLKLHYSVGDDFKTLYNSPVMNSHHLQTTPFDMINYQDIKHA